MKKEKVLILAVTFLAFLTVALLLIKPANAQEVTVFIDAPDQVEPGTFQVKINVTEVTGLYGWEFKLYYENYLLNFTGYDLTGCLLESGGGTFQVDNSNNEFNSTHGLVWLADTLLGAPTGVNGSGTLVILNFKTVDLGPVHLVFEDLNAEAEGKNIKLGDKEANPIPNVAIDKTFEVVPEFTLSILLIALFTSSSMAVYLVKKRK